jgi:hypothetical protein
VGSREGGPAVTISRRAAVRLAAAGGGVLALGALGGSAAVLLWRDVLSRLGGQSGMAGGA